MFAFCHLLSPQLYLKESLCHTSSTNSCIRKSIASEITPLSKYLSDAKRTDLVLVRIYTFKGENNPTLLRKVFLKNLYYGYNGF